MPIRDEDFSWLETRWVLELNYSLLMVVLTLRPQTDLLALALSYGSFERKAEFDELDACGMKEATYYPFKCYNLLSNSISDSEAES